MGINNKVKKRVIVIEDDKDINKLITYNLENEGFYVESIFDGNKAAKKIQKQHFDIVILDIMLPGKDGFQICKIIKDIPSIYKTYIVIISAKCNIQDKLYAHILGADHYICKPFNISALIEVIKDLSFKNNEEFRFKNSKNYFT
ncbi:MAG: response regulator [Candidatus Omnitrophota bacterium]